MSQQARVEIDLKALPHVKAPALRRLAEVWLALRGPDLVIPPRRAFDPFAVPELAPKLWLCDYDPVERRFAYRLAGEHINRVYGRSIKGLDLSDVIPAAGYEIVRARYLEAVEAPAIVHTAGRVYVHSDRYQPGERLILPLADDAGAARFVLGATIVSGDLDFPDPRDRRADQVTVATALARNAAA